MGIGPVQRQSIISLASTVGLTAVGFLSTMYFAHAVGPAILGAYYLFLAYFGIFNIIGDGGFGGAAVKRISEGEEKNSFFTAFALLRVALLCVSVSLLLIARPFLVDLTSSGVYPWLIVALVVSALTSVSSSGVYGSGKVGVYQISGLINNVLKILFQVAAVFLGFGVAGLAGGFVAGLLAAAVVNFHFLDLRPAAFGLHHISSLFSYSFWTFLSASGYLIFSYADTVLIGYFLTDADVGIYRVALQLTSVATFVTIAMHTTLYPRVSHWSATGDLKSVETALARAFTYSLLLAVPVLAGGLILGERLLYFFYGASFAAGAGALAILLVAQVVHVFMFLQTMGLNAIDRPRDSFRVTAVAVAVNIALNMYLIPMMEITGAAVATLATMALSAGLAYRALSRSFRVQVERRAVGHICLAAFAMAAAVGLYALVIPLSNVFVVLGGVALGGIVYGIALLKLDAGIHDDLKDVTVRLGVPWPDFL